MSRPRALADVTQETRRRVEQLGQNAGVARLRGLAQRERSISTHGKAEPTRDDDGRSNAAPLSPILQDWTIPSRAGKGHHTTSFGSRIPDDGASAQADVFEVR